MSCNRVGCEKPEEYYPVLLIRPKGYTGTPARVTIKMGLCEEHAKGKTEDFITEHLWRMIKGGVSKLGLGRKQPHRSSTGIEFLYIEGHRWKTESLFIFEPAKPS